MKFWLMWYVFIFLSSANNIQLLAQKSDDLFIDVTKDQVVEDDGKYYVKFSMKITNKKEKEITFKLSDLVLTEVQRTPLEWYVDTPATIADYPYTISAKSTLVLKIYLVTVTKKSLITFEGIHFR